MPFKCKGNVCPPAGVLGIQETVTGRERIRAGRMAPSKQSCRLEELSEFSQWQPIPLERKKGSGE